MPLRILLADDHVRVRHGFRARVKQARMAVLGEASDGQQVLWLAHTQPPAMAILDLAMPRLNGLETARRLRVAVPQNEIVLLIMHTDNPYV
jgi:DNA-binding NarL/FixJ family response regulator